MSAVHVALELPLDLPCRKQNNNRVIIGISCNPTEIETSKGDAITGRFTVSSSIGYQSSSVF